jgi:hypothetical protein
MRSEFCTAASADALLVLATISRQRSNAETRARGPQNRATQVGRETRAGDGNSEERRPRLGNGRSAASPTTHREIGGSRCPSPRLLCDA